MFQGRNLTEEIAGAQRRQHHRLRITSVLEDLDTSRDENEEGGADATFPENDLATPVGLKTRRFGEDVDVTVAESFEERCPLQQVSNVHGVLTKLAASLSPEWLSSTVTRSARKPWAPGISSSSSSSTSPVR